MGGYPVPIEVNRSVANVTHSDVTRSELLVAHPDSINASFEDEIGEEATTTVLHPHALHLAAWE
jgi:hypothetical protein